MVNFKPGEMKELRKLAGVTQAQLERLSGIDSSALSLAETGQIPLRDEQAEKVRSLLLKKIESRVSAANRVLRQAQREAVSV